METGDPEALADLLADKARAEVRRRMALVVETRRHAADGVPEARAHVQASLGLQVWSHGVFGALSAGPHGEAADVEWAEGDAAAAGRPAHAH